MNTLQATALFGKGELVDKLMKEGADVTAALVNAALVRTIIGGVKPTGLGTIGSVAHSKPAPSASKSAAGKTKRKPRNPNQKAPPALAAHLVGFNKPGHYKDSAPNRKLSRVVEKTRTAHRTASWAGSWRRRRAPASRPRSPSTCASTDGSRLVRRQSCLPTFVRSQSSCLDPTSAISHSGGCRPDVPSVDTRVLCLC